MQETKDIYITAQFADFTLEILKKKVRDWVMLIRILTKPLQMSIDAEEYEAFNFEKLCDLIDRLTANEKKELKINSLHGEFQLHIIHLSFLERTILDGQLFLKQQALIEDYLEKRMVKYGIYATIRAFDEYLQNNIETIEKRYFDAPEKITTLPKRYTKEKSIVIDCNQLAGYNLYFKGLCFTSCWKMYYSKVYFQLIPKQVFLTLQQVEMIEELSEDVLKVVLFTDPFNWQHEVNLHFQRLYRDQLGFDQFSWTNGVGVLRPPYIEYSYIGTTLQVVQYQNRQLQPVEKKNATHFVTRSYDFKTKEYQENQLRGSLNVKAFFPWIDDAAKQMITYRLIEPEYTLDEGVEAYVFFIRECVELDQLNENEEGYTCVLRFYVPEEALTKLPFQAVAERLNESGIHVSAPLQDQAFTAHKAQNHLSIVFLTMEEFSLSKQRNED